MEENNIKGTIVIDQSIDEDKKMFSFLEEVIDKKTFDDNIQQQAKVLLLEIKKKFNQYKKDSVKYKDLYNFTCNILQPKQKNMLIEELERRL